MRKRKILVLSITIVAIALILETCILRYVNEKNAQTTSNVLLDRVIAVLDKNESSEGRFVKSLKDDYIVLGNDNVLVTKKDGRVWRTKEPAIIFFYFNRWFNLQT